MHGPTRIFWANLTSFSLQLVASAVVSALVLGWYPAAVLGLTIGSSLAAAMLILNSQFRSDLNLVTAVNAIIVRAARGVSAALAFPIVNRFCMGLLYERAGCLRTKNGGFHPPPGSVSRRRLMSISIGAFVRQPA
jgi:hypothetical protein